jgi:hypothetical protein
LKAFRQQFPERAKFRKSLCRIVEKKTICPNYSPAVRLFQVLDFVPDNLGRWPSVPCPKHLRNLADPPQIEYTKSLKPRHCGLRVPLKEESSVKITLKAISSFLIVLLLAAVVSALSGPAFAACPDTVNNAGYVLAGAGGSHTGADWNNPYTALPATLSRGCTYYVAGGSYSAYNANTAASGSTFITIQAATLASHGTATGWSSSYATDTSGAGSNQAVFTGGFAFTTGYWTVNGAGTYTGMGCGSADPTGHGAGGAGCNLKIQGVVNGTDFAYCAATANNLSACTTHITASYIEIAGCGYSCSGSSYEAGIYGDSNGGTTSNGGGNNFSFSHFYIHQVRGGPIFSERANTIVFDHNYVIGNASTDANHAEAWADMATSNVTVSNNAFVSIEGSGYIVELDRGGCADGSCAGGNNWSIFGNVFWYDNGNNLSCKINSCNTGIGDGVIACINALICNNWVIYQNTFVNIYGLQAGLCLDCTGEGNVSSAWTVKNNFWWNNTQSGVALSLAAGCSSCTMTEDYNTTLGYGSGQLSGFTGAHDVTVQSTPASPFVGWSSSPANFQYASESSNWNNGLTLASPENIDPDGVTRGSDGHWDLGVFQFASAAVQPPANLTATVH